MTDSTPVMLSEGSLTMSMEALLRILQGGDYPHCRACQNLRKQNVRMKFVSEGHVYQAYAKTYKCPTCGSKMELHQTTICRPSDD